MIDFIKNYLFFSESFWSSDSLIFFFLPITSGPLFTIAPELVPAAMFWGFPPASPATTSSTNCFNYFTIVFLPCLIVFLVMFGVYFV